MHPQFPIRLLSARPLAPTVYHYVFERSDGDALDFVPGQFIQLHFEYADGTAAKRSYSLATQHDHALGPGEAVEFAVSFVPGGRATALFENLAVGDTVICSGPYGRFVLDATDRNARYLLIGTGTGITPYRSMLPQLAALMAERGVQVHLLQGARTGAELLYADEFTAFAAANPLFHYHPCLSRETTEFTAPNVTPIHGYVQQALDAIKPDAATDIAYLCGNPNMVDACFTDLKDRGLSTRYIRREKYVSNL